MWMLEVFALKTRMLVYLIGLATWQQTFTCTNHLWVWNWMLCSHKRIQGCQCQASQRPDHLFCWFHAPISAVNPQFIPPASHFSPFHTSIFSPKFCRFSAESSMWGASGSNATSLGAAVRCVGSGRECHGTGFHQRHSGSGHLARGRWGFAEEFSAHQFTDRERGEEHSSGF